MCHTSLTWYGKKELDIINLASLLHVGIMNQVLSIFINIKMYRLLFLDFVFNILFYFILILNFL